MLLLIRLCYSAKICLCHSAKTNQFISQMINHWKFNQRLTTYCAMSKHYVQWLKRKRLPFEWKTTNITSPINEKNDWCDTAQRLVTQRNIKGTHYWQRVSLSLVELILSLIWLHLNKTPHYWKYSNNFSLYFNYNFVWEILSSSNFVLFINVPIKGNTEHQIVRYIEFF